MYEVRSFALTLALGKESARRGIRSFVECSTAHVYKPGSTPRKEDDKMAPWHGLAKWKHRAAEELHQVPGLRFVILRFPHVYGEYDPGYFAMGICMARVHEEIGKEMEMLYTKDLKVNTVYVRDAARALFTAAEWRAGVSDEKDGEKATKTVFNVVDHGDTKQEHLATALAEVFGVKCSFLGSLVSQMAKMNLDDVVDDLNEDNLQTWAELLEKKAITRPGPISPFLERDVLKDQDMCIDGSLFEETTGWKPERERLDANGVRDIVESYKRMGWWP